MGGQKQDHLTLRETVGSAEAGDNMPVGERTLGKGWSGLKPLLLDEQPAPCSPLRVLLYGHPQS